MVEGRIVLAAAVAEYLPRTYDTLYAIRIDGREYLLPAANLADFERERAAGSNKWQRHVHARMSRSGEQGG